MISAQGRNKVAKWVKLEKSWVKINCDSAFKADCDGGSNGNVVIGIFAYVFAPGV